MKSINLKKLILPNLPYLLFVFLFDKVGQAARLAPGVDFSGKLVSIGDGFAAAFSSFAPSLHPADLLVGILGAALIRLVVYVKGKNAKKYRRGVEYGSARWGSADDIRPYIDPVFENNVLLTQTERLMSAISSGSALFSGLVNGVIGTSYTSEDSDLVAVENNYAAKENDLQSRIDNIERDYPGYDEYRYDLAYIGHNPHELASYLTALLQTYTPQSAQAELDRIFNLQYKLTVTEEIEVRYRTERRTGSYTDAEGNTHTYTYTVEVPYNYYILNVTLTNKSISSFVSELLTPEQLEMYRVYLQTSGNKPLVFGGGSADTSASENLSGVTFVNGTRPGNTALVDIAKSQVGNVGGAPYWSWYGFDSRVAWCACFVSWCYGQAGLSEPRFAGCQSQGVPWFTSHGQWGARGYENIAPGDAIFFDWDLDGSADHVGIVIGTDGSRVYTVEGNSGDACKIRSYPLDYACIKGYGLMNWN